jgi:hypothetical protein
MEIQQILDLTHPHIIPISLELSAEEIQRIRISLTYFHYSIRLFVKMEYPKHCIKDIPMIYRRYLKPSSIFLHRLYELCINAQGRDGTYYHTPYKNGHYWFLMILKESLTARYYECTEPLNLPPTLYSGQQKARILSCYSKELSMVKRYENPYKSMQHAEHLSRLMDFAIEKSQQSEFFRKSFLNPYLKAGRDMITNYRSPKWQRVSVDAEGKIYLNRSGSRSKKRLL